MIYICQECHAHVAIDVKTCPACGGKLIPSIGNGAANRQPDHRGILLPSRHPVGGVITPR